MFSNINITKIMDIIIGRRCWHQYLESWKSWSQDWTGNSNS
ncbi:hypothetical protein [Pseudodesulfovibrio cashew]|nr:hypothetical protein [Pseudodesulfovibrio cashew]